MLTRLQSHLDALRVTRPPGPSPWRMLETLRDFSTHPLAYLTEASRRYGDRYYLRLGPAQVYGVHHPDDIEEVLVRQRDRMIKDTLTKELSDFLGEGLLTSDGEQWRRQRKLAAPSLQRKQIAAYADTMVAFAEAHVAAWGEGARDINAAYSALTLEIVVKTLFGLDFVSDAQRIQEIVEIVMHQYRVYTSSVWRFLPRPLVRRAMPGMTRYHAALTELDQVLTSIIQRRKAEGAKGDDLLSRLLQARYDDGGQISDAQLRDEAATFFLAGHETTTLALTFATHLLAHHPEALAVARAEVDAVLGDRAATVDDVPALVQCDAVVREAMRLYPPAWAIGREPTEDITLGGFTIPAGSQLFIAQWVVHRDPRHFAQPLRFRPARWLDGSCDALPRFAYFPFGGGPRVCIGNHFAMMEAVLVLATVLQRVDFEALGPEDIELVPAVTLRPAKPVMMQVTPRGDRERH